jgi:murein DD-endopeptidase MepM/ murein hydrolase activator NlpD
MHYFQGRNYISQRQGNREERERKIPKKKTLLILFVAFLFPCSLSAFSVNPVTTDSRLWLSGNGVNLQTTTFVPGDTIKLSIGKSRPGLERSLSFAGRRIKVTGETAYIAVPLNLMPGKHFISVREKKRGPDRTARIAVKILEPGYPVEYVNFSPENKEKIGSFKNRKEKKLIRKALKIVSPVKLWEEKFSVPVKGNIKGKFGAQRKMGETLLWQHKGVDISAGRGTPVRAPVPGRVILARDDFNLHGNTVILDHGIGIISLYIHLDEIMVKHEEHVKKGQVIGRVGSTGLTTAPNLHWGIYVYSEAVNPLWWLNNE